MMKYAYKSGIQAIGITDHDNTDGVEPCIYAAEKYRIEVIPGVELSSEPYQKNGTEIHILGYLIDWKDICLFRFDGFHVHPCVLFSRQLYRP